MTKIDLQPKRPHIGRNIRILRNLKGIKQEALSAETDIPQPEISEIENSEDVDEKKLLKIAEALSVTPELIKTFDENYALYNINNKLENVEIKENSHGIHQVFNSNEKVVVELYERLLASEKEKVEILKNFGNK
ncbi:helix-turn-helix transcriptional regulator [Sinomicrobium kalidii]|uniref:helix-turn-helix domain-containing protein n=1 Tax=Sinomicrobium kalidii TaxID=2900738 RepID=UPI001E5044B7|nr:helix-turn-helix transcriptional regulator [Sinomicrobium kalidii]UGU15392.1 helix-turn-helix transcriptional regulator [Sinomicrobium kalidii]